MRSFITGRAPSIMVRCPKLLQVSEVFDSINTSFLKSPLLVNLNSSFFPFIHVKFVLAQYVLLDSTRSDGGSASAVGSLYCFALSIGRVGLPPRPLSREMDQTPILPSQSEAHPRYLLHQVPTHSPTGFVAWRDDPTMSPSHDHRSLKYRPKSLADHNRNPWHPTVATVTNNVCLVLIESLSHLSQSCVEHPRVVLPQRQ